MKQHKQPSDERVSDERRTSDEFLSDERRVEQSNTQDSSLDTLHAALSSPDSKLQTPDSTLSTPDSTLSTPDSPLQTPDSQDEESLYEHHRIVVPKGIVPVRLDVHVTRHLSGVSRNRVQTANDVGALRVNGKTVKTSYKIKPFDEITLMLPYPPPPELVPEYVPLDIVFEDDDLMVVNKPAGLVVHPGVGHHHGTLVHGLLWHFGQMPVPKDEPFRPGLVHRLDKDTTGIMVVAKREFAMMHLANQFFNRTTDRQYQALVWGDIKQDEGKVVAHIGRNPRDRQKFMVVPPENETGKHAVTHYRVLERFGFATLVALKLETGRTHQIRVHMQHLGHTLFGDAFYGGDSILAGSTAFPKYKAFIQHCLDDLPRQGLHAKTLAFDHPGTGERLSFNSELPEDMQAVIGRIREYVRA